MVARVLRRQPVGKDECPRNEHDRAEREHRRNPTPWLEGLRKGRHSRVVPRETLSGVLSAPRVPCIANLASMDRPRPDDHTRCWIGARQFARGGGSCPEAEE